MCFHLTATLPKSINIETLRPIINQYGMAFDPLNNPNVSSQLRPGELNFVATKGHCDCGTVLGALSTSRKLQALLKSKKARNLQKKGWSEDQIVQWAEEKLKKRKKSHGRKYSPVEIEQETARWINFLRELLQAGNLSHVGLIKHWYRGRLDTEQFSIKKTEKININETTADFLTKIEEDTLYEFFIN
ncbi:MAG: hypothetical protein HWN65_06305 [Candidatus Helarchaeota archaeon]|nr:hypothetical protein [Candidatus Helarchaeota archaeon]